MQCRGDLRRLALPIKGGDSEMDVISLFCLILFAYIVKTLFDKKK